MKRRNGQDAPPYSEAQATAWLAWLARGMQAHDQTIFLIEQLQPSWLSDAEAAVGLHLDVAPDLGRCRRADCRAGLRGLIGGLLARAEWRADLLVGLPVRAGRGVG